MAAILEFKMAADYHVSRDGYLALKGSPSFKLHLCQFPRFCQQSERFLPLASPLYVVSLYHYVRLSECILSKYIPQKSPYRTTFSWNTFPKKNHKKNT